MEKIKPINQFEVLNLFPKPLSPQQVTLKVWLDNQPIFPPEIQSGIAQKWTSLPEARDGQLLGFIRSEYSAGHLTIHAKPTTYRIYQGTNLYPDNFSRLNHTPDLLGNGLVCTAVIITADNQLIFGLRTNGKIGTIGGTVNTDEVFPQTHATHLFMHQDQEIKEELGLTEAELADSTTRLLSVSRSLSNFRPLLTFVHHTKLFSDEISSAFQQAGNKTEHLDLISVPADSRSLSEFITHPPRPLMPALIEAVTIFSSTPA